MNHRLFSTDLKRTDPTVISLIRFRNVASNPKRFVNPRIFGIDPRDEKPFGSTERNMLVGDIRLKTRECHKLRNALLFLLRPAGTKEVRHWFTLVRAARFSMMKVVESGLVGSDRKGMRKLKGAATRMVTRCEPEEPFP